MARERTTAGIPAADRVLLLERVFDAPRDLVWNALTEREHAERWWSPKGLTVTYLEMDVRPGCTWRKCMQPSGGQEICNGGIYREVARPERLVFTYRVHQYETLVTITLAEHAGKTKLTLHQSAFESVAHRDSHLGGWTSSTGRLAEYLASQSTAGPR